MPFGEISLSEAAAPRIAAIILAGGLSSRMGRNKLLIELDGEPLIRRAARMAQASRASPLIVVTGHDRDNIVRALSGVAASLVHNPDFGGGLSTSLRAGIDAVPASCTGALIILGDMPGISARLIDTMIAAFAPDEGRAICVAVHDRKRGNPVLWARRFFPYLRAITGDIGARHVIVDNDAAVCEVDAHDDGPLTDIDTPEALASFLARDT
jgi:molybdenum cofactor cytidylyltransferase